MKKQLLTAAALVAFVTSAHAEDSVVFKPYVGVDVQRSVYSYNDNYDAGGGAFLDGDLILEDALNGMNIHIGSRVHENVGVELGYFRTKEEGKTIANGSTVGPGTVATADFTTKTKSSGFTLDALGYVPVDEQKRFELIGTAGVSWTKAEIEAVVPGAGSGSVDDSEVGFSVGGGAQFNVTDRVNIRGLARYQTADFSDVADRAWTYSVGLNYSF